MTFGDVVMGMGPGWVAGVLVVAAVEGLKRVGWVSPDGARTAALGVALVLGPASAVLWAFGTGQAFDVGTALGTLMAAWIGSMGLHDAGAHVTDTLTGPPMLDPRG